MNRAAAEISPVPREFTAGPLRALLAGAGLRYLSVGCIEAVRRIYVGVRDASWETIEPIVSDVVARQEAGGFRVEFDAEHVRGDIDFAWHGHISAQPFGAGGAIVRYEMDGIARSTFATNRTGICLLHPVRECVGAACDVVHPDGTREPCRFPVEIAPHQPFIDIRSMAYRAVGSVEVGIRFEGEVFETEDQRNWADGSFKTYSRPLALPFPYVLERGQAVRQSVTVSVAVKNSGPAALTRRGSENRVTVGTRVLPRVPPVGLGLPHPSAAEPRGWLPDAYVPRLREMELGHLRLDLDGSGEPRWCDLPDDAFEDAVRLGVPLELGLHFTDDFEPELARLVESIVRKTELDLHARWWCVYAAGRPVTPPDLVARVRSRLKDTLARPVGSGTVGNFAELNRERPAGGTADFLAFPVNPQVHATDDLSLIENLQGLGDTIRTARAFAPGVPVRVGPVTLHRRPDPFARGAAGRVREEIKADARQRAAFGAAWTLGSLKYLAEAGADAITYYQTAGPFGVMDDAGEPYPAYHVLKAVGPFRDGDVLEVSDGEPLYYTALAMRRADRLRVLVANLRPEPSTVTAVMPGGSRQVTLGPYEVKTIDEAAD